MANLWPWLAVAGLGALHGLSPANGWMFAAAWGVQARKGTQQAQARRALLPIAIGHAASIVVVACAFAQGMSMDRARVQDLAGALLVGAAAYRLLRGAGHCTPISTQAGLSASSPRRGAGRLSSSAARRYSAAGIVGNRFGPAGGAGFRKVTRWGDCRAASPG
jgi:hypothetical protein